LLDDDLESMRLFNEKVNVLRESSFAREMFTKPTGLTIGYREGVTRTEVRGPDQDAINAAVLTLRFFIQDNERTSLRNMADTFGRYRERSDRVDAFLSGRRTLNEFLDASTEPRIVINQDVLTSRRVLEMVIYGERAHSNETSRKKMKPIRANPIASAIVENEFNYIVSHVLKALFFLQVQNQAIHRALTGVVLPISWPTENPGGPS